MTKTFFYDGEFVYRGVERGEIERTRGRMKKSNVLVRVGARGERRNNLREIERERGEIEEDGVFEVGCFGEVGGVESWWEGGGERKGEEEENEEGEGEGEGGEREDAGKAGEISLHEVPKISKEKGNEKQKRKESGRRLVFFSLFLLFEERMIVDFQTRKGKRREKEKGKRRRKGKKNCPPSRVIEIPNVSNQIGS